MKRKPLQQFEPLQRFKPLKPEGFMKPITYQAAARRLRQIADQLEKRCKPKTPRQKAALTSAIYGLSRYAQHLAQKHRRTTH